MKLGQIKDEICQHKDGKFRFLTPYKVTVLPAENALALQVRYKFDWRRTSEKWANFCLRQLNEEYPTLYFKVLRHSDVTSKEFLAETTFEAVITISRTPLL